jgi:DNA-binding transcriptional regulator YiaG
MKQLPHFALERVYLENGYTEEESDYGPLTLVNAEHKLEDAVRKALLLLPRRLNGRHLRFLRRGLGMSQARFGELIGKDGQTVARLEKRVEPLDGATELAIRAHGLAHFEPQHRVADLVTLVHHSQPMEYARVVFTFANGSWTHSFELALPSRNYIVKAATTLLENIFIPPGRAVATRGPSGAAAASHGDFTWTDQPTKGTAMLVTTPSVH